MKRRYTAHQKFRWLAHILKTRGYKRLWSIWAHNPQPWFIRGDPERYLW